MPGTTDEPAVAGMPHTRRSGPSASQARVGRRWHRPASHARARGQKTDNPASATQAVMLQERARIARELHDSLAQTLYAITLGASRARSLLQLQEHRDVQNIIDDVLALANAGQAELREFLTDIRSDRLTAGGLTAALAHLGADARTRSSLDMRLSVSSEPDMPAPTKEALLMIAREAIHNVIKHAAAHRIDVALEHDAGHVVLLIDDDGRGFAPAPPRPGHFGLQAMRECATAVGGALALTSAVGLGTHLRVSIPAHVDPDG